MVQSSIPCRAARLAVDWIEIRHCFNIFQQCQEESIEDRRKVESKVEEMEKEKKKNEEHKEEKPKKPKTSKLTPSSSKFLFCFEIWNSFGSTLGVQTVCAGSRTFWKVFPSLRWPFYVLEDFECIPIGFCYFLQDLDLWHPLYDAAGDEWTDSQVAKGLTCLSSSVYLVLCTCLLWRWLSMSYGAERPIHRDVQGQAFHTRVAHWK